RMNPKVITQTVFPDTTEKIRLTPENLVIAWRLENEEGLPVDFSNILYPTIYHYDYKREGLKNEWQEMNSTLIANTKCSEKNSKSEEFNKYDLTNWYCMDWTSGYYNFGGF